MRPKDLIEKRWGYEEIIYNTKYCVKLLHLKENCHSSYHYHAIKDETFYIIKGSVYLRLNKAYLNLHTGDYIHIPPKTPHLFYGLSSAIILESSTEDDFTDNIRDNIILSNIFMHNHQLLSEQLDKSDLCLMAKYKFK